VDWRAKALIFATDLRSTVIFPLVELSDIRSQWNEILGNLEAKNRVAWIAYFDARLSSFENNLLTLDFSDSRKFAASHEYSETRPNLKADLLLVIEQVLGQKVEIAER